MNNNFLNISENIKFIFPLEKQSFLDSETYKEISKKLSKLGKHGDSIEWLKRALKEYEKCRELDHVVKILHNIGNEYRHQGKFNEALQYYYEAASVLYKNRLLNNKPEFRLMLDRLRIEASINMVQNYLLNGNFSEAYSEYDKLIREGEEFAKKMNLIGKEKEECELYKTHAIRQKAEMIRLMGKYKEAEEIFNDALDRYKYYFLEEKTYSILGIADSLRMQGKFNESQKKIEEVLDFAEATNNKRLLVTATRKIVEINRIFENENVDFFLSNLKKFSDESNNFFGKVYFKLISGGVYLKKDPEKAEKYFDLSKIEHEGCGDIKNYKVEYTHALFGKAEAKRFCRDLDNAKILYKKANEEYKKMKMNWGIENTQKGLNFLENKELSLNETFFLNIP